MKLFLRLFSGRDGVYGRQWIDDEGHRGFSPVKFPLNKEVLIKHLAGDETIGLYLIRKDNTLSLMAVDVDIDRKFLLEYSKDKEKFKELEYSTQKDANRVAFACEKLDLPVYTEDSGYKGRHCWLFFERAVPAKTVRQMIKVILGQVGSPSQGVHWEIFPNVGYVKEGKLGPLLKLPLGVHKKTGRRCFFVDRDGRPYQDQASFLEGIKTIASETVEKIVKLTLSSPSIEEIPSDIEAVLEGCGIVHHLVNKARDTNYLAHMERVTLLYTLGHLGEEGKRFLHRVIGYCLNYNYDFTERQIKKMKESPISCARIREIHEDILLSTGCPCRIKPPPKGYSSPVLYAYRKGFNPQEKIKDMKSEMDKTSLAPTLSNELSRTKEESINTVLKRYIELKKQQRGVEGNLKECDRKMCEILDRERVDSIQTEFGLLVRKQEGDKTDWIIEYRD